MAIGQSVWGYIPPPPGGGSSESEDTDLTDKYSMTRPAELPRQREITASDLSAGRLPALDPDFFEEFVDDAGGGKGTNRFGDTPAWSTANKDGWYELQQWAKATYGFNVQAQYQGRVDRAAKAFYQRNGYPPSASELMSDPTLNTYLYSAAMKFYELPATFAVTDGPCGTYYNDPWKGPQRVSTRGGAVNELGPGAIDQMLNDGTLNNSGGLRSFRRNGHGLANRS